MVILYYSFIIEFNLKLTTDELKHHLNLSSAFSPILLTFTCLYASIKRLAAITAIPGINP